MAVELGGLQVEVRRHCQHSGPVGGPFGLGRKAPELRGYCVQPGGPFKFAQCHIQPMAESRFCSAKRGN
jgi:hypothetical protein